MANNTNKKTVPSKTELLDLFNHLDYDHQCVVIDTFKSCAIYDSRPPKGSKPYDVSSVIKFHQEQKEYKDQEVCDKVNANSGEDDPFLALDVYIGIKNNNPQFSRKKTNWLKKIAEVLDFSEEEYKKFLTPEGLKDAHNTITDISSKILSIDTLYDSLDEKDQKAMQQLVVSLLNLQNLKE